jgi:hypothetical protein
MRKMCWLAAVGIVLATFGQAQACLRNTLDDRAIQWSTAIVKATFIAQKEPAAGQNTALSLVASTWKVAQSLDGPLKPETEITILTFPSNDADHPSSACQELPGKGKTYVLLLRPVKDCEFAVRTDAAKVGGDPYIVVYRLTDEEATDEAVKDLQQRIDAVRKADAAFSDKDAKFQAETLANAVDETEAADADKALVQMGPKALPAVKEQMPNANAAGKTRLQRIVDDLSPPPADTEKRVEPARD